MLDLRVDFGRASFSHTKSTLQLEATANCSLQTSSSDLCDLASIDAADFSLLDLWVRPCRPLSLSFAISFHESLTCSAQNPDDLKGKLSPILASSAFWSQLDLDAVDVACTSSPHGGSSRELIEITLDLDTSKAAHQNAEPAVRPHDVNDINCPTSIPTARLTGTQMSLDFRESIDNTILGQEITIKVLTSMIDAALRELIGRRPSRPTVGVKKTSTYKASLQTVFPAIFCPGHSKEIDSRVYLISKISSSIINCKNMSNVPQLYKIPTNRMDGSIGLKQEICNDPVDTSTIQNSLFTAIVHFTGYKRRNKALQPLNSEVSPDGLSKQLSELPDVTESLSLFDQSVQKVGSSPTHLFFQYLDAAEEENVECPIDQHVPFEVTINEGPTPTLRASPSFEDITLEDPHDETLLEHCNSEHDLASHTCSEASSSFISLSKLAYGFPNWELDDHVSMLRETRALTEGCLPIVSSANSAWSGVIGEDDGLTQNPTRSSPPGGCTRTTSLHEQVHTLTACQPDKASEERLSEDLFTTLAQEQPIYQALSFSQPSGSNVEHLDTKKLLHTVPDFREINVLEDLDFPMSIEPGDEPSLADLLREEKFSQDMWNRRRSTAINDIPSTFQPSMPTKAIGTGWRLKPQARDLQETPARPAASYQMRNSRSPADQDDSRPYFSKRSSITSISSSAPQSPTEQKPQRRNSLLRRWSKNSRSPSDQEMLDFDMSSVKERTVEVKRRKTIEDYDRQDRLEQGEEDEDMLFA